MNLGIHDSYILKSSDSIDIFSTEQVMANIDLEVAPVMTLQLSGYVRDRFADGENIGGAAVLAYAENHTLLGKTCTDDAGYYFFGNLPAGTCKLTAAKDGHVTAPFVPVLLEPGLPVRQDLVLPPAESAESLVYGRVTDADGTPLEGVSVSILDPNGRTAASTFTTPGGEYAVYGLPDGSYTVVLGAQGYSSRRFDVSVTEQSRIHNRSAALPSVNTPAGTAAISGFITNSQGTPLADAWVGLYASGAGEGEELIASTAANGDGFYLFSSVLPGQYTVKAKAMVV